MITQIPSGPFDAGLHLARALENLMDRLIYVGLPLPGGAIALRVLHDAGLRANEHTPTDFSHRLRIAR